MTNTTNVVFLRTRNQMGAVLRADLFKAPVFVAVEWPGRATYESFLPGDMETHTYADDMREAKRVIDRFSHNTVNIHAVSDRDDPFMDNLKTQFPSLKIISTPATASLG